MAVDNAVTVGKRFSQPCVALLRWPKLVTVNHANSKFGYFQVNDVRYRFENWMFRERPFRGNVVISADHEEVWKISASIDRSGTANVASV